MEIDLSVHTCREQWSLHPFREVEHLLVGVHNRLHQVLLLPQLLNKGRRVRRCRQPFHHVHFRGAECRGIRDYLATNVLPRCFASDCTLVNNDAVGPPTDHREHDDNDRTSPGLTLLQSKRPVQSLLGRAQCLCPLVLRSRHLLKLLALGHQSRVLGLLARPKKSKVQCGWFGCAFGSPCRPSFGRYYVSACQESVLCSTASFPLSCA